jgi:ribonuclease Z
VSLRQLALDTSWGQLTVVGGSRAGEGTLVLLPQLKLALDPGRPHRALPPMSTVVVSHGHLDHLGGLGYWASQRFLQSMGGGTLVASHELVADLGALLAVHARLEGGRPYDVEVVGTGPESVFRLRRDVELRFFPTDHWVPTLGTEVWWTKTRLRPDLEGLDGDEIARRRAAGAEVTEVVPVHLLSYCADSGPRLLTDRPGTLSAEVVLLECSFFRPGDRDRAERYGHLHVDDLLAAAARVGCRHLVLLHASRRHRLTEVEERIERDVRPRFACEVHHLIVDWP